MELEGIIDNVGKGFATGMVNIFDPVGRDVSNIDYHMNGAGFSDGERGIPYCP
tara:strand:- start:644 stop:802 length:159 start_codon:yes stop_codon:yes gene_type:complete